MDRISDVIYTIPHITKEEIIFPIQFVPMLSTSLAIKLILPEVWKLSAAEQQPVQELVMDLKERY